MGNPDSRGGNRSGRSNRLRFACSGWHPGRSLARNSQSLCNCWKSHRPCPPWAAR